MRLFCVIGFAILFSLSANSQPREKSSAFDECAKYLAPTFQPGPDVDQEERLSCTQIELQDMYDDFCKDIHDFMWGIYGGGEIDLFRESQVGFAETIQTCTTLELYHDPENPTGALWTSLASKRKGCESMRDNVHGFVERYRRNIELYPNHPVPDYAVADLDKLKEENAVFQQRCNRFGIQIVP